MEIYLVKKLNGSFVPAHDSDYQNAKKIKLGEPFRFDIKQPRNQKFHRKFFALINLVFENQEIFANREDLRKFLTMKAGYYKRIETTSGEMILPKSVSFAKMDGIEFAELYDRVLDVIQIELNFDRDLIEQEMINQAKPIKNEQ